MNAVRARAVSAAVTLVLVAACASPREHFYTLLESDAGLREPAAHADHVVIVGRVTVPVEVDRPELVIAGSDHRVVVLEQERWIEPLAVDIRRALTRDLAARLPQAVVREEERGAGRDALRVEVSVLRFDAAPDAGASLEAHWEVFAGEAARREGMTVTHSVARARGYPAMVAADAATIDRMSEAIAAAITSVWGEAPYQPVR